MAPFFVLAIISIIIGYWHISIIFLIIAFCFIYFFRDPQRKIPQNKNLLTSPADGKIVKIQTVESHPSFPSSVTIVSIFLSLFDVHITRSPLFGIVKEMENKPGQFFPAYKDEASSRNKSNSLFIDGNEVNILIKQIAGVLARRIKCFVEKNRRIKQGEKIGLIYFGSRVEVFLPQGLDIKINVGQKVKAGETVIAEITKREGY